MASLDEAVSHYDQIDKPNADRSKVHKRLFWS
jgi:hypothetical protein